MKLYGSKGSWFVIPQTRGQPSRLLNETTSDYLFGKPVRPSVLTGEYGVCVTGDVEQACQLGTYLDLMSAICAFKYD